MKTPSLKLPRISKKVILVSLGTLLVLGLIAYGAIRNIEAQNARTEQQALDAKQTAARQAAATAQWNSLSSQDQRHATTAKEACDELKTLQANKTIAKLVVVPELCSLI